MVRENIQIYVQCVPKKKGLIYIKYVFYQWVKIIININRPCFLGHPINIKIFFWTYHDYQIDDI